MARAITSSVLSLSSEQLRWRCDPSELGFVSTTEVPPLEGTVGQARGVEAVALGLALDSAGFNLYVAGPPGSGRATTARTLIQRAAAARPSPPDWCYLHNFGNASQPVAVQLPTGRGPELASDLDELIADCRRAIPAVFEGEQYQRRRADLAQRLGEQREAQFAEVRALAAQLGFAVEFTPMGVATVPLLEPGKPLTPEAFELLPDPKRQTSGRGDRSSLVARRKCYTWCVGSNARRTTRCTRSIVRW
jgi:hypothetical protein